MMDVQTVVTGVEALDDIRQTEREESDTEHDEEDATPGGEAEQVAGNEIANGEESVDAESEINLPIHSTAFGNMRDSIIVRSKGKKRLPLLIPAADDRISALAESEMESEYTEPSDRNEAVEKASPEAEGDDPSLQPALESGDAPSSGNQSKESDSASLDVISRTKPRESVDSVEEDFIKVDSEETRGISSKTGRPKKKVTFISDDDKEVATEFVDAPDPFRFAAESNVPRVLEAYAHACLQKKVQPLPKVLESVKKNPGNRERTGTFDLSGENLDLVTIDTFEPVFMRMCFEELNASGSLTDDELAVSLMDMVEYYQMVDKLVIGNNKKLSFRGWLAVAKVLKKCSIYYLDIRSCLLLDQNASLLTRAIRLGSNLVTLHVENCGLSGRPVLLLISALQYSETVKEIFLGDNKLTPTDMIHFGNAFKHGWRIRLLDLRNNFLSDDGAALLLQSCVDNGAWLADLRQLNLWENRLSAKVADALRQVLLASWSLETLNLGNNELGDEFVFTIKDALLHNHSLRRLGLQAAKLSDEGCIALAEYIANHTRFLRLDVRFNEIRCGGWLALAHAIKISPSMIRLDMNYSFKDPKHFETIRECQRTIQTACLNNIERYERGQVTIAEDEEENEAEMEERRGSVDRAEDNADEDNLDDDPSLELPDYMEALTESEISSKQPSDIHIDKPTKKTTPVSSRRGSISSVTAIGPLSVIDRLHEELFPMKNPPPTVSSSTGPTLVKGRFQINLVKATEKLYQSVQSVLSPVQNPSSTPLNVVPSTATTSPATETPKGLFSWRPGFTRRNSKDAQSPVVANTSPISSNIPSSPPKPAAPVLVSDSPVSTPEIQELPPATEIEAIGPVLS